MMAAHPLVKNKDTKQIETLWPLGGADEEGGDDGGPARRGGGGSVSMPVGYSVVSQHRQGIG